MPATLKRGRPGARPTGKLLDVIALAFTTVFEKPNGLSLMQNRRMHVDYSLGTFLSFAGRGPF